MKKPEKFKMKRVIVQFGFLILLAMIAWQGLHRTPTLQSDVYPYLTSLSPALVKQCIDEHKISPTIGLEELLAIRSTFSEREAQPFIEQLKNKVTFTKMNWGSVTNNTQEIISRRLEILNQYPFYQPYKYQFPVIGKTWFDNTFGADREGGKRRHEGTDLFGKEGTPIVSVCDGKIEQLGWNRLGGERVGIRGDDGNYYYYAHLQSISTELVKGKRVKAGESLGTMGHTGDALTTPDHLHFGIEIPNEQWINPYPFIEVWRYWAKE